MNDLADTGGRAEPSATSETARARASGFPVGLAAAVLVYLALRASMLALRFDETCNPSYELTGIGNLAHALSSGNRVLPVSGYFDNCGGHLATGLLATPLYLAFGDSYLTLKVVPLLHGLLTMVLTWAILAPRAGRGAATLACAAFALGPPILTRLSVMAMGSHFESLVLTFAGYLAWLRWRERGRHVDALVFGAVAGLSVFLYLGSLLWLGILGLSHLYAAGPRATARDVLRLAPGFLVGLLPLVWIAFARDGRIADFFSYNLGNEARPGVPEGLGRFWDLLVNVLPKAGLYPDLGPLSGALAEACLVAACALAWLIVARAGTGAGPARARTLPLLLYPPLVLLALAVSRFDIEPTQSVQYATTRRYLAPYFGLSVLTLGFAYGELARMRRPRLAAGLVGLLLATAPFALALALPPSVRSPSGTQFRGWSGAHLSRVLLGNATIGHSHPRPVWDVAEIARRIAMLPEEERPDVAFGLGFSVALLDLADPFAPAEPIAAALPEALAEQAAEGVGAFLREACRAGYLDHAGLRRVLERQAELRPGAALAAARGLSREFPPPVGPRGPPAVQQARALEPAVPAALREAWVEGLARADG